VTPLYLQDIKGSGFQENMTRIKEPPVFYDIGQKLADYQSSTKNPGNLGM